ncbi:MAG: ankyrin repeat domain-containing protein [Thermofilum sp.]|uniref:ankyrin repeat domain-containing protein n=1 Tax=Thermofilum sp. TaxID=1961369 RepID=UPI00258B0191|nr:ankyrin repeat domain-containing protein [Thermofilum sp.]MCI4407481.1 ankyrin repeat domain-containing protein [Thermofilum sp.]
MNLAEELFKAAENGDVERVKELLASVPDFHRMEYVNATPSYGSTPLHYAAYNGHTDFVKLLLENGADPSIKDNSGKTAADLARERGHIEIANMIENVKELFEALKKGDTSKAEKLLANLRVPNARDRNGVSLLHWATFIGHAGIARSLIEKGADVNIKDRRGKTPLHYSAKIGDTIIAKLFLEKGADINARDERNCTPLHYAANVEVARLLIEKGADINAKSELYDDALSLHKIFHELIIDKEGRVVLGEWSCEDYLYVEYLPLTPLHFAIIKGDVATVKLLIEKGSGVSSKTSGGITPLHLAAVSGNADVAKLLLESGADANARDDMGRIPLHYASNASVVKMLIEAGADINARDKEGVTPLHYATHRSLGAREPLIDVVKTLLEYGADVNVKTTFGVTPLHVATYYGEVEIVKMLIKRGADVNARTSFNRGACTPLHYTLKVEDPLFGGYGSYYGLVEEHARHECITLLVKYGADVNARDANGNTSLHYLFTWSTCDADTVKLLLENGADPTIRNNQGISVLELIERFTRDSKARESQGVCGRRIKEFWVKSMGRLVSSGKGAETMTVVCPYCSRPAYHLGTVGRYYCFSCKRYV